MARILILAYGNPLRSDDGVAWRAAEQLRSRCPSVTVVSAHQLMPEFAERVSEADGVIFLDAAQTGEPGQIASAEINPESDCSPGSHCLSPAQVMALCRQLYGLTPRAVTISVTGARFDHGDTLSEALERALPGLIAFTEDAVWSLSAGEETPRLNSVARVRDG